MTPCAQRSGQLSVLHRKSCQGGVFDLKIPGGDRESLKENIKKKMEMRKENKSQEGKTLQMKYVRL